MRESRGGSRPSVGFQFGSKRDFESAGSGEIDGGGGTVGNVPFGGTTIGADAPGTIGTGAPGGTYTVFGGGASLRQKSGRRSQRLQHPASRPNIPDNSNNANARVMAHLQLSALPSRL